MTGNVLYEKTTKGTTEGGDNDLDSPSHRFLHLHGVNTTQ